MTWSRLVHETVKSIAFFVSLEDDVDLESVASMEIFTLLWCFITSDSCRASTSDVGPLTAQ
jgi:hypothetical protein